VTIYIALLRKDPDSDYGVDFPDFPGCITAGSTLEETRAMAAEALEFHIEGMLEESLPIPDPSPLDDVMADPENAEAIPFLVSVPDSLTGTVRVDVALSPAEAKALDALAKKLGKSRSAVLTEAARRMIAAEKEHHAA
jgi:predicted RNase H-like HicB family nuclease